MSLDCPLHNFSGDMMTYRSEFVRQLFQVASIPCWLQGYNTNIRAILDDEKSIKLGSIYESDVASELIAHGYNLFYYDNRSKGEVDYLIDDYDSLSVVPIEVKSGIESI